jgi:hypothetical protein
MNDNPQQRGVAILLYEANDEIAHFTPFLGLHEGELVSPNEGDGLRVTDVEVRRSVAGIFRQAIVAFKG